MKRTFLLSAILSIALIFGNVFTQELTPSQKTTPQKTPRIVKKQVHQHARIKQGVKSGELTRREAVKLKKGQAKIQHDKQAAKSDGKVTPQERKKIRHEQRKASRDIYRAKHNDKTRK